MSTPRQYSKQLSVGYRWQIALRLATAILIGYALATVAGILLAYTLPMTKSDAVMTGILASFAIYACCVIWVFAVKKLRKAILGLLIPTTIFGMLALLLHVLGVAP